MHLVSSEMGVGGLSDEDLLMMTPLSPPWRYTPSMLRGGEETETIQWFDADVSGER